MKRGRDTGLVVFSLVTQVIVVSMEPMKATRYQARLHDTPGNRAILARAMYGKPINSDGLESRTLACAARLLYQCVRVHGAEPIPLRVYREWPYEKIFRPDMDRLVVNVLATETAAGINVYASVERTTTMNPVPSRFFQRGTGAHFAMVYTSNTVALFGDEPSPLVGPGFVHRGSPDRGVFAVSELSCVNDIADAQDADPLLDIGADTPAFNTAAWDSNVFDAAMNDDGRDVGYDELWCNMQVATARITPRAQ